MSTVTENGSLPPEAPPGEEPRPTELTETPPGEAPSQAQPPSGPGQVSSSEIPAHFSAPALLPLERLDDDATYRIRPLAHLDDVSALATDIARLGQLTPIDVRLRPPDRFQIITGFRRVAALRFLKRDKVQARLHTELSDDDAMLLALAAAIHGKPVSRDDLVRLRERLEAGGHLGPPARDMLDKALELEALSPETVGEEEVDPDELASDVAERLSLCNQDLRLLADVLSELEPSRRDELLRQLRYSADLVAWLEQG